MIDFEKMVRTKRNMVNCLLLLAVLLFSGCIDDQIKPGGDSVALSVGKITMADLKTRSTTAVTSGDIGVFLSGTGYTARSNVKYSYGSPSWTSADPLYLSLNSATICVYHPYSTGIGSSPVTLTSQLYSSAADLSYASAQTKTSANPNISFSMVRAYAKLTFHITHDATYNGPCSVTNAGISSASSQINSGGALNLFTAGYTYTAGAVSVSVSGVTIASGASWDVVVLMVPVTSITGALTLSFTVDGYELTGILSAGTLTALASGVNYTINATVKANTFTVSLASIGGSGKTSLGAEPANCYIIAPGSSITIPVSFRGNGEATSAALASLSTTIAPTSVGLLWQTSAGLISSIGSVSNGCVTITTGSTSGNAVIAAYDTDGTTILWSWHIWVTSYDPTSNAITYTTSAPARVSYTVMDRNLGALGITYVRDNNMLHYQFGRKDPFPASGSVSSYQVYDASGTAIYNALVSGTVTMAASVLAPQSFYYNGGNLDWCSAPSNYWWMGVNGTTTTPGVKTIYDPCPAGWRVPAYRNGYSAWYNVTSGSYASNAMTLIMPSGQSVLYPAAGCRYGNSGAFGYVGSGGGYWSASPGISLGCSLYFNSGSVYPSNENYRANGFPVRCVQEW